MNEKIVMYEENGICMKKRLLYLLFPVIALILEILPFGAVCNFAVSPERTQRKTFSYFSLVPYGYANFTPFITAVITCAASTSIFYVTKQSVVKQHEPQKINLRLNFRYIQFREHSRRKHGKIGKG